jgi:hypothetical protein
MQIMLTQKNDLATFHQLHGLSKDFSQPLLLHENKNGNLILALQVLSLLTYSFSL